MDKKAIGIIGIIAILVAVLALVAVYYVEESPSDVTQLTVYSEGPMNLSDLIDNIETTNYYAGYDPDTLNWMKSLGDMKVYQGDDTIVIMSSSDAEKIPSVFATDVSITETFECNIVESHSLGVGNQDVMFVKNVKYLKEEIISDDLAQLTVYSEGPVSLSDVVEDIENTDYYVGYDPDTLNWMKSLGDMEVFMGNGTMVIMSSSDAQKIPSVFATDVIITEIFECNIVESHSLGEINYPKDVMLVKNVRYLKEEIINLGLA